LEMFIAARLASSNLEKIPVLDGISISSFHAVSPSKAWCIGINQLRLASDKKPVCSELVSEDRRGLMALRMKGHFFEDPWTNIAPNPIPLRLIVAQALLDARYPIFQREGV